MHILSSRRTTRHLLIGGLCVLSVLVSATAGAIDFTTLAAFGGPLGTALAQLNTLTPGLRALVGFLAFVVTFISLAALKNFGPVLFYVGVMIFGSVGLAVGGAILGATI